jgi:hypothetical protein
MVQFKYDYAIAELVNNGTTILLTWKGFISSPNYRETLEKSLEIAKKNRIKNWISDIRLMKVLGPKDQEWAGTDWLPRAVAAGCYHKQAVIMAEDLFGELSAKKILATVQDQQIEIQNFVKVEDAKKWLSAN